MQKYGSEILTGVSSSNLNRGPCVHLERYEFISASPSYELNNRAALVANQSCTRTTLNSKLIVCWTNNSTPEKKHLLQRNTGETAALIFYSGI